MDTEFIPPERPTCANCGIDLLDDTIDEPDREKIRLLYEDDGGYYCEACWFHEPYGSYTETGDKIVDNPRYGTVKTHELEEDEYVYVEYKSAYSTERQTIAGKITSVDIIGRVTVDTLEETPDGEPILYRLDGDVVEKYNTNGDSRRVSHRYGSRLAIYRLDESDVVLPEDDAEDDAVLVADGGESPKSADERMEYCEACEERVPEDEAQSVQMTMGSHHDPPEYVTLCDSCYADLKREAEEQARAEKVAMKEVREEEIRPLPTRELSDFVRVRSTGIPDSTSLVIETRQNTSNDFGDQGSVTLKRDAVRELALYIVSAGVEGGR